VNPWTLLINGLGSALAFFYDIIPEYGIAIILLTVSVSLLLFPLTLKQTKSMKGMQEIQPAVKRLQKEYKEDREELNKRLMELYKEKGVNPAAGCLPMLVQMPIWFALYRVLWQGKGIPADSALSEVINAANQALYTVGDNGELTGTLKAGVDITASQFEPVTFLGMNLLVKPSQAVDLSNIPGSLPYIILILVIVAAGFYQQVQTTRKKPTDDGAEQQNSQMAGMQNAMKIMPVVFGFISWNFVAGLGLYFATSNLFRVAQQALILRMGKGDGDEKPVRTDSDEPSDDSNGDSPNSRPSENASKKRNRRRKK
jgi:YidC/Oxa1 family membrane protein insertase